MDRAIEIENGLTPRIAIQGYRTDGTVFFWNRGSEVVYGYPAAEAVGKNLGDLIIPDPLRPLFRQALRRGRAIREFGEFLPAGEVVLKNRSGEPVTVYSTHIAARIGGETFLFCIDLDRPGRAFEDSFRRSRERLKSRVAERTRKLKDANADLRGEIEARKEFERKLQESEERFRSIFDNAQDAIFIETPEGKIIDANRAVCRMLGYTRSELLSLTVADIVPADLHSTLSPVIRRQSARPGVLLETENLRKDGTRFPVEVSNTIIEVDGEERVVAIVRDISARKRAETERRAMEEQLRQAQKMEMAAALAGGMAHDFGNLLNAIRGYVEVIKEQLRPEDPLRREIGELDRSVHQAAGLVRKLFAIGRRGPDRPEAVKLNLVIEELAPMLERVCGPRIRLTLDFEPGTAAVAAPQGEMEQVIVNLVLNAREAIDGAGEISIVLKTVDLDRSPVPRMIGKKPGRYLALTVIDTGCGMTEAEKARLFEPFFTTKNTENNSGLGMPVVYGTVERNGGFIQVESSPGEGSVFTIYIPVLQAGDVPAVRRRILVMDDEESFRKIVVQFLTVLGCEAAAVPDGRLAAELYQLEMEAGRPFDAVLLDLIVPGDRSGADTLYRLKEIDPGVKAILCSGYTADPLMTDFQEHGFAGVLSKPFQLAELRRTLEEIGISFPQASGSSPEPAGGGS
ncbi:MAG: PAS domain S-box protein [Candidatus Erginobacter occultus]|nr:PAS domain S-box protein [Candidatus Erginobacter occultus]